MKMREQMFNKLQPFIHLILILESLWGLTKIYHVTFSFVVNNTNLRSDNSLKSTKKITMTVNEKVRDEKTQLSRTEQKHEINR